MTEVVVCPTCDTSNLETLSRSREYYCKECNRSFPKREARRREKQGHSQGGRKSMGVRALLDADPSAVEGLE